MPSVLKMSKSPISSSVNRRTSVNVKRNLDLRYTFRRWRDANQIEVPKKLVVTNEFTLALEDLHFDSSLAVRSSREDLRDFSVGMVGLREVSLVMMPPSVSIPVNLSTS